MRNDVEQSLELKMQIGISQEIVNVSKQEFLEILEVMLNFLRCVGWGFKLFYLDVKEKVFKKF